MALRIEPGPLPQDGERFQAEAMLTAFVGGTRVFDFDHTNFADSGVGFILSSTDPPATATRNRAVSWFKRGEGVLYHWFVFTPNSGPDSGVTNGMWLAGSGTRKELAAEFRYPVTAGWPVFVDSTLSEFHAQRMNADFMMLRVAGENYTSHTDVTTASDAAHSNFTAWHDRHYDPCFVAVDGTPQGLGNETGWSGRVYGAVADVGYVRAAVSTSYTAPGKLVFESGNQESRFIADAGETVTTTKPYAAHGVESGVTNTYDNVLVFLRPMMSHRDF